MHYRKDWLPSDLTSRSRLISGDNGVAAPPKLRSVHGPGIVQRNMAPIPLNLAFDAIHQLKIIQRIAHGGSVSAGLSGKL
jgi:hypothetical protein